MNLVVACALIAPAAAIVSVVLVYPLIQTLYSSFTVWTFSDPSDRQFVGLDNYLELLNPSGRFLPSLQFTLIFTVAAITLELIIGLAGALILARLRRGRTFASSIAIMPFMMATLAVGLVWRTLFDRQYGLINYFLDAWFGIDPINWLGDEVPAIAALVIAESWASAPFVMLLILAGLVTIPAEVLEASRLDGASSWQGLWLIKLPLIKPALTVALIFQTVLTLRLFDLAFSLTRGGPGTATTPVGLLIQRTFFGYFEGGPAAAMSISLCLIGGAFALIYIRLFYRND